MSDLWLQLASCMHLPVAVYYWMCDTCNICHV